MIEQRKIQHALQTGDSDPRSIELIAVQGDWIGSSGQSLDGLSLLSVAKLVECGFCIVCPNPEDDIGEVVPLKKLLEFSQAPERIERPLRIWLTAEGFFAWQVRFTPRWELFFEGPLGVFELSAFGGSTPALAVRVFGGSMGSCWICCH